jgi:type IV secretion system protein VirB9
MKKRIFAALAIAAATLTQAAWAYDVPGSASDSRIRSVIYDPDEVVRLYLQRGFSTHIVLDKGEQIVTAAPGDSENWIIVARKGEHDVYIKPKVSAAQSNLNLTTTKRSYAFDLLLLPNKASMVDANKMYLVRFVYPDQQAAVSKGKMEEANVAMQMGRKAPPRNFNYTMQALPGSDVIEPTRVYDDGRFTYITIPNNREIPVVFKVSDDKSESLTNYHMECNDPSQQCSDTIVVHEVAKRFVLRLSKEVVGLWNESYDPDGVPPTNGMTVGGGNLKRVIRSAKDEQH